MYQSSIIALNVNQQNNHFLQNEYMDYESYFPFGRDRNRVKRYVIEQLNGQETKKNQQILLKFREEATLRKHYFLNKKLYMKSNESQLKTLDSQRRKNSYSMDYDIHKNEDQSNNYRYHKRVYQQQKPASRLDHLNFSQNYKRRYRTIDNQKYYRPGYRIDPIQNYPKKSKKSKSIDFPLQKKIQNHQKNSSSKIRNQNYRDKALKNIKQIAKSLRQNNPQEQSDISTLNQSKIIQKIKQKEQFSEPQLFQLNKKLKLLKKYKVLFKKNMMKNNSFGQNNK